MYIKSDGVHKPLRFIDSRIFFRLCFKSTQCNIVSITLSLSSFLSDDVRNKIISMSFEQQEIYGSLVICLSLLTGTLTSFCQAVNDKSGSKRRQNGRVGLVSKHKEKKRILFPILFSNISSGRRLLLSLERRSSTDTTLSNSSLSFSCSKSFLSSFSDLLSAVAAPLLRAGVSFEREEGKLGKMCGIASSLSFRSLNVPFILFLRILESTLSCWKSSDVK